MFWPFKRKSKPAGPRTTPVAELESQLEPDFPDPPEGYRVYSRAFDREVAAADMIEELGWGAFGSKEIFRGWQAELREAPPASTESNRRAQRFVARWKTGHALGDRPVVTLLIDHSGSMKGAKARTAAKTAVVVGEVLERLNITVEILGFTTSTWRGGNSRKLWLENDRLLFFPGRLCDLLHIVYRNGEGMPTNWSSDLALLFDDSALKENVDGEALLWARERAVQLGATAWVCVLIGDGAPVDDSTIQANGFGTTNWFLQRHLDETINALKSDDALSHKARLGFLSLGDYGVEHAEHNLKPVRLQDAPDVGFDLLEQMIWPESEVPNQGAN